jgi:small GTP-binding protein
MLGTFAVGKTSLIQQFVYSQFKDDYLSTIGVQLSNKTVDLENQQIKLILWDLAHVEKFDGIVKSHLLGSHAAIVVFDLTRPHSFAEYEAMISGYLDINPDSKLVLAGNKSDLSEEEETRQKIATIAAELNCPYFITSAKTAENVEAMFHTVAQQLV